MNGNKKVLRTVLAIAAAAVGITAVLYILWYHGAFLPRWIVWQDKTVYDASQRYKTVLHHKSAAAIYQNALIWNSPERVKVQDALSCDIDRDGQEELVLLCWKTGRYGKYKPFWVEKDEQAWSQHIFVYEYQHDEIVPKWMSSYIGQDVSAISAGSNAAGTRDLINDILLTDLEGAVSRWRWESWGFVKQETDVSFTVFGDNLLHEPIWRYGLRNDEKFGFLFEHVKDVISGSDVAVINQETPLVDDPSLYSGYPRFGTPVQAGQAVVDAGFDVVTCATNHALDKGTYGIETTKKFFASNKVLCLGIQLEEEAGEQPYEIIVRKGIRFALFNYTYGTNGIPLPQGSPDMVHLLQDEGKIKKAVSRAKAESDMVIVFAHWGTEDTEQVDGFQHKWTQIFLESGVDIVVGTHPHVIQPYEMLTGADGHEMLVYYSIGNYISAQPEKSCIKGGMARFTVSLAADGYQVTEYTLQPLTITWISGGRYSVAPE